MKLLSRFLVVLVGVLVLFSTPGKCQDPRDLSKPSKELERELIRNSLEQKSMETGTVVYAVQDVAMGEQIPSEALEEKQMPKTAITPDALGNAKMAIGNYATYNIKAGQLLLRKDISSRNSFTINLDPSYGKKLRSLAKTRKEQKALVVKWVKSAIDKSSTK